MYTIFLFLQRKEGVLMTHYTQHKTQEISISEKSTHVAQSANYPVLSEINEETLDQITGGRATPKDTSGWKQIYPGMTISPDGKYFTYHGSVLPNSIVHID
jgi:hypothetical protein